MVAGTAAAVGMALANDRRLTPVFVEATPQNPPLSPPTFGGRQGRPVPVPAFGGRQGTSTAAETVSHRFGLAALIGVGVLLFVASVPALTTFASSFRSGTSVPAAYGPPAQLRAASGVGGNWERSYASAAPSAGQLGAALLAGVAEQHSWDVMKAMHILADREAGILSESDYQSFWTGGASPHSLNAASGIAAGTVFRARITIYGCTGPGGGFCNHLASGGQPFAGAVACSSNLPFGTKLTIDGDPTGRVYECLDRGALAPTWVDVYFDDTSDGMAWQSSLGSTIADITIVN